jgi:hypothetical protein
MRAGSAICVNPQHYTAEEAQLMQVLRAAVPPLLKHPRLAHKANFVSQALANLPLRALCQLLRDQSERVE